MNEPISADMLIALAEDVRALLRRADHHGLAMVGIHLDNALTSLAALAPAGIIVPEPFHGHQRPGDDDPDGRTS